MVNVSLPSAPMSHNGLLSLCCVMTFVRINLLVLCYVVCIEGGKREGEGEQTAPKSPPIERSDLYVNFAFHFAVDSLGLSTRHSSHILYSVFIQPMDFWKDYGILEKKFHIWKNY